ncbi:MAG: L-lactate dehydrogenase [Lachnospiraceae bacterium]|nr:L-lactate dehydrogenase [Lachnospiraceae bacterium]MBO5178050.1 L-lactate dehydrogenase [Lachnospiraceae bacterium]
MSRKITIIGAGSVGATIAYTLSQDDIASEIVMIDVNRDKAEGEVMDIIQGTCFREPISITSGDYEDAKDSDIVIITSGVARKPGQSRLELAQTNVDILKDITPQIAAAAPNAKYIIVSNPVDVLTYVFTKISGIPENQIIGSGTVLDTARLRCGIAEHFNVAQKNVHAYVFGEHGDTSFIPWSKACISAVPMEEYVKTMKNSGVRVSPVDKEAMLEYVQKSGGKIIANKGATFYAVSAAVCKLCSILLASTDSYTTVSTMMHGEYGIEDVCLSTLALVGPNGCQGKVEVNLTDEEEVLLKKSADTLKGIIAQLQI